jgi:hypothetical protein
MYCFERRTCADITAPELEMLDPELTYFPDNVKKIVELSFASENKCVVRRAPGPSHFAFLLVVFRDDFAQIVQQISLRGCRSCLNNGMLRPSTGYDTSAISRCTIVCPRPVCSASWLGCWTGLRQVASLSASGGHRGAGVPRGVSIAHRSGHKAVSRSPAARVS